MQWSAFREVDKTIVQLRTFVELRNKCKIVLDNGLWFGNHERGDYQMSQALVYCCKFWVLLYHRWRVDITCESNLGPQEAHESPFKSIFEWYY